MNPIVSRVIVVIAALPAHCLFDEGSLLAALQNVVPQPREGSWTFSDLTIEIVHISLTLAADAGIVREIEIEPGLFRMARTNQLTYLESPRGIPRLVDALAASISQPDDERVSRALRVSVENAAIRRAILDPIAFTWPIEDYAALLNATTRGPSEGQ